MENKVKEVDFAVDTHLSPEVKSFLKSINTGGPGLETLSVPEARAVLVSLQAATAVDLSGIEETEKTIEHFDHKILLNIVRPEGNTEKLPVFIYIHGGGWVLGDFQTHKRMVRDLVVGTGAVGVFVNYTPSPEAQYPQAINEIYAATSWVAENGDQINVDGKKLAVVGNSVGGNMTAATCLLAKQYGTPHIRAAVMMWPIVDAGFEHKSYLKFGKDRFLTTPLMKWMYNAYTQDPAQRKEILASPLEATIEQLQGLPPTLIQVAENDILRDGGEAYGRKLSEAGVKATTVRYNGVIHDFGLLNGLATIPQTKELFSQASAKLKKHLFM